MHPIDRLVGAEPVPSTVNITPSQRTPDNTDGVMCQVRLIKRRCITIIELLQR